MNAGSQWRYSIASQIAPVYAENPHVAAVILSGSSARGHADRFSDIELGVFWHRDPTETDRMAAVRQTGGDLLRLYPYDVDEQVWSDDFMIGRALSNHPESGVLVEIAHHTVEFMEHTLHEVLAEHNPHELKQNLIAGLMDGIALPHSSLIEQWQARAGAYPELLSIAVVNRHAQIDHFWRWQMWLQRGPNLMMLYQSFAQVQQKILHVLLGLNRVYYFGFKWLAVVIDRLSIAPTNLAQRLQEVYMVPPADGARKLATVVEETYDLVERHLPAVDVTWLRNVFRYQRPFWDSPPALT